MEELTVAGVSAVVVITLLVSFAKGHGLDGRWAPAAALILGIVFAVLVQVSGGSAIVATWFEVIVKGLMTGFAASGLYSGQKAVRARP